MGEILGRLFEEHQALTGTAVASQDWTNGSPSRSSDRTAGESAEHGRHRTRNRGASNGAAAPCDLTAVNRIVAAVLPLQLQPPVLIAPPKRGSSNWTAKSMTPNRPFRVDLEVDGATGAIKARQDFWDRRFVDKIVAVGIAAHEGRLFGWPNQLLGLMTASGLIVVITSSIVMWWRRREPGTLGAPGPLLSPRFSFGLCLLVVILGIYLPLFGISLIAVKMLEVGVLNHIPRVRDWLGLQTAGT